MCSSWYIALICKALTNHCLNYHSFCGKTLSNTPSTSWYLRSACALPHKYTNHLMVEGHHILLCHKSINNFGPSFKSFYSDIFRSHHLCHNSCAPLGTFYQFQKRSPTTASIPLVFVGKHSQTSHLPPSICALLALCLPRIQITY